MTPQILDVYQKEYEQKQQDEVDMIDYASWLNGMYVMEAISTLLSKNNNYSEKPHHVLNKEEKQREESPTKTAAQDFANWALAFNMAKTKKDGDVSGR